MNIEIEDTRAFLSILAKIEEHIQLDINFPKQVLTPVSPCGIKVERITAPILRANYSFVKDIVV